ncbi:MAG: Na(+)/H(+) antiporter NhaA, partial [Actinobacteria bacterium]|nr:Na(+)/H(+) antiporter NhaA [Actinomycetota bacterium]
MSQPFFQRLSRRQRGWVAEQLRDETVGGGLLLLAAAIALLWANSPWADSYATLVDLEVGPASVGLNLSLGAWAADGLLSVFFLVVGLELKHELVVGSLSKPSRAAVPIAAALGGMVVPALLFAAVNSTMADGELAGWGIPMATDIAFALAVLAVIGRRLPVALRAFLLTLAVVDDLGAISVIAVFYSTHLELAWLSLAIICFVGYAIAQRRRVRSAWLYVPLALLAWYAMHESGVHATVTGVVLGLLTRVRPDA